MRCASCKKDSGFQQSNAHFQKSLKILKTLPPRADYQNVYYYYHATAVVDRLSAEERQPWRTALEAVLLEKQERQGKDAGSWPEKGDAFGSSSGRVMTTALSLLMLEPPAPVRPQLAKRALPPAETAALWDDLAKHTPVQALESARRLAASPEQAVPFIRARLRPPPPLDPKLLASLIKDLDDERFAVREQATAELARRGELAVPALRQALENKPSLEVTQRIEVLLQAAAALTPERVQVLRGIRVLERAEARATLEELARGEPALPVTAAAAAALRRLVKAPDRSAD